MRSLFRTFIGIVALAAVSVFSVPMLHARDVAGGEASETGDAAGDAPKEKREGSAWILSGPLGMHVKSDIDTLLYNYQRRIIPSMQSDAYATTGNLGAEGINMIYYERPEATPFYFDQALDAWTMTLRNQKLYNVYTPMTLLSYNMGGNKQNHTDRLTGQFAGNVNRRIGVSAYIDYLHSKGCYEEQAAKALQWGAGMYYLGDRYELQALYNHYSLQNKESGGITDELYITDPAEVQGGVEKVEPKSIPTRLTGAQNRTRGTEFFMTHALKLGFWDTEQVNDTLTRDVYVPVTRLIYSLKYENRSHNFKDRGNGTDGDFWAASYFNRTATDERGRYWALTNTLGIEMIEGFRKWAKFGLSAYASYQLRRFTQPQDLNGPRGDVPGGGDAPAEGGDSGLTPLPQGVAVARKTTQNLLWVGGRLQKTSGTLLNYDADVKFGLVGDVAGDIDAKGGIGTNFKLFGDTVSVAARAHFSNLTPSWFLREYSSNHFIWSNDFGKTRRVGVGGSLTIPWTRTKIYVGFDNTQNLVYFDGDCLPRQNGGNVQVFTARLNQRLHFGIWNWNNTLTYQATSDAKVLPLPAFTLYSNMYLAFKAFKVLDLQIGVDCDYYTNYRSLMYQPATMTFHTQKEGSDLKVGNYAFANAYVTAKLYKVRFYVMWAHFNQGWLSKRYFSLPYYPLNTRRLMLGLCVDFAD